MDGTIETDDIRYHRQMSIDKDLGVDYRRLLRTWEREDDLVLHNICMNSMIHKQGSQRKVVGCYRFHMSRMVAMVAMWLA